MSKINLFFNFYHDKERQNEINYCLAKNREVFDRVIIVEGRPTFNELFALSKDYPDDINVYCNSDIYFPDIKLLHQIKENECWALCRWNMKRNIPVFFNRPDSADSWVFRGTVKSVDVPFTLGLWGNDNRLAYELHQAGYIVTNPSLSIRTHHVHANDKRDHVRTPENTVPPPYLTILPSKL